MDENASRRTSRRGSGYIIERELGRNGFATVSLGVKDENGRRVTAAAKRIYVPTEERYDEVLKQYGQDGNLAESYFQGFAEDLDKAVEAMIAVGQKDSRNILAVYDYSKSREEDPLTYYFDIVTEYMTPLHVYLAEKGITTGGAVRMGIDVCEALTVCHGCDVVHGAIRESNIFVKEAVGKESLGFKLGDIGISRILWDPTDEAQDVAGPYLAPELYKGDNAEPASDIYAVGIVLYRLFNDLRLPLLPTCRQTPRSTRKTRNAAAAGERYRPCRGNPVTGLAR